jgi:hypothetical protein
MASLIWTRHSQYRQGALSATGTAKAAAFEATSIEKIQSSINK